MSERQTEVLIISNTYDFGTDFICAHLLDRGIEYLRLNWDELENTQIILNPIEREMHVTVPGATYLIRDVDLRSVYFRAPTYLRETSIYEISADEKFSRTQWATLIRSLSLFDKARWVNSPQATYLAENKPVQLAVASDLGFHVPRTVVSNTGEWIDEQWIKRKYVAAKGIDTVYLKDENESLFTYTVTVSIEELRNAELKSAPVIFQELLEPKIDIRVTVIDRAIFAVEILDGTSGVTGDWRLMKNNVSYRPITLPDSISESCVYLVQKLGLVYGAIDLVYASSSYYFIEINPTGEWVWLAENTKYPLDVAIVDSLLVSELD